MRKDVLLNSAEAYDVMFMFLKEFYARGGEKSDPAHVLKCLEHGSWADEQASTDDWERCARSIKDGFNPYPPPDDPAWLI